MVIDKDLHETTPVSVRLIFVDPSVDPDVVTLELSVLPDEIVRKGEMTMEFGTEHISSVGKWMFCQLASSEDSIEFGTYTEWHEFLSEKSKAFERLRNLGYGGYLEIESQIPSGSEYYKDDIFIDSAFVKLVGQLGLGINVWYRLKTPKSVALEDVSAVNELIIPGPRFFYRTDEDNFFTWLKSIPAVRTIKGHHTSIILRLVEPTMDDVSLRSLIALMTRYQLDMSCLKTQLNENNAPWFKESRYYWHQSVFGDDDNCSS